MSYTFKMTKFNKLNSLRSNLYNLKENTEAEKNLNLEEELLDIIGNKDELNPNEISIYDLIKFYRDKNRKFTSLKETLSERLNASAHSNGIDVDYHIIEYDPVASTLLIYAYAIGGYYEKDVTIVQDTDDIYERGNSKEGQALLRTSLPEIRKSFKSLYKYSSLNNPEEDIIVERSSNTHLLVDMAHDTYSNKINLYTDGVYMQDLNINSVFIRDRNNDYELNITSPSGTILELLSDNKNKVLKRTMISIDKCPRWAREELYELRENTIEEIKTKREKEERKENIKKKILFWK